MKLEHLAIWTKDLDRLKIFYEKYFHARAGEKYFNSNKQFSSYFLYFEDGCRIEIMQKPGLTELVDTFGNENKGLAHFAFSVGSKQKVDELTNQLRTDGFAIISEPRTTGDGYYESQVADPDRNLIEITI